MCNAISVANSELEYRNKSKGLKKITIEKWWEMATAGIYTTYNFEYK